MELEIDELLGLPAHPLIVHAVLALVPGAALLTVVAALWPTARRRIGWLAVLLAVLGLFSVWVAQGSGEELENQVEETHLVEEHTELGDQMLIPAIALLVGAVLVTAVGRQGDRAAPVDDARAGSYSTRGASAISVIVAVVALATSGWAVVWVFRAGHSGAKAVWDETGKEGGERDNSGPGGGGESEDSLGLLGAALPLR